MTPSLTWSDRIKPAAREARCAAVVTAFFVVGVVLMFVVAAAVAAVGKMIMLALGTSGALLIAPGVVVAVTWLAVFLHELHLRRS